MDSSDPHVTRREPGEISEITELRETLYNRLSTLSAKYNLVRKGAPMLASIATELFNPCEKRVEYDFENGFPVEEVAFDSIFSELHTFVVGRLMDSTRSALQAAGFAATVSGEVKVPLGRYDLRVQLSAGTPCRLTAGGQEVLRLEAKTGKSLPFDQLSRYVWASETPLVLARLLQGQVAIFRQEALRGFVDFGLKEAILKADRILEGSVQVTPGSHCYSCPVGTCEWNKKPKRAGSARVITVRDLESHVQSVFTNLPTVARQVGLIAVRELEAFTPADSENSSQKRERPHPRLTVTKPSWMEPSVQGGAEKAH